MPDSLPAIHEHAREHDQLLAFMLQRELGYFLTPGPVLDMAIRSPVYRDLMRQAHVRQAGDLLSLTALWFKAGSPEDNPPDAVAAYVCVEDRGDAGVWGDWESALWYAQSLDGSIDVALACDLAC